MLRASDGWAVARSGTELHYNCLESQREKYQSVTRSDGSNTSIPFLARVSIPVLTELVEPNPCLCINAPEYGFSTVPSLATALSIFKLQPR